MLGVLAHFAGAFANVAQIFMVMILVVPNNFSFAVTILASHCRELSSAGAQASEFTHVFRPMVFGRHNPAVTDSRNSPTVCPRWVARDCRSAIASGVMRTV